MLGQSKVKRGINWTTNTILDLIFSFLPSGSTVYICVFLKHDLSALAFQTIERQQELSKLSPHFVALF